MRIFSKILLSSLVAFVCAGSAFGANPSLPTTSISGKTYYQIQSCADLKAFATSVNSGSTTINGIMVASFDCAGSTLTPIGNSSSYKYSGTFDGNGFSIKNVSVGTTKYGSSNPQYAGLFGYITTNAVIENVFVEGAVIYARNSGTSYAGVIAAYNEGGKITSCVVKDAQVYAAKGGSGNASYSGGIVGYSTGSTSSVTLCSVGGNSYIEATQAVGGVAGTIEKGAVVENCLCGGDVESVANQSGGNAGGIVGENGNTKTGSTAGSIERCVYTGDHVKPGATDNAYGGAIVGNGTACTSKCYYTYEGLKVGNNDEFNDDLESIKNELGNPWDTMNDEDGETLILNPRDPVTGVPQTEMYYDVTFNLNGHGTTFTQTAGKDHLIAEPEMVVVNENGVQYGVSGWYKEAAGTNAWNFATEKVLVKGIILYAQWKVVYKVAFDANGGSFPAKAVKEKYFAAGETITTNGVTNPITSENKVFRGWAESKDATAAQSSFGTMPATTKTLYAVWEVVPTYTVTYNPGSYGSGSVASGTKLKGVDFTLSKETFTRSKYAQVGWCKKDKCTSKEYDMGGIYSTDASITLYPYWSSSSYTITYKPGNGDGVTGSQFTQTKAKNVDVNLSSQTFTREGFVQDGWSVSAEGTTKNYGLGALYVKNADLILYPHWVKRVTVTFMNGSEVYDTQTVDEGSKVSNPSNPTKTNYEFEGWYKENTFVNEFKFFGSTSNESLTENTTLYAKFKQTRFFVKIEVVGNAITPQAETVGHLPGSTITLTVPVIPDQHKQSTVFDHWEVVKGGVTITDNSFTMPEADVELKAHFIEKPAIKYSCGSMEACVGDDVTEYKNFKASYTIKNGLFTLNGFTQSAWATEENGDAVYAFGNSYSTDKDLSLYPFFTKKLVITLSENPEIKVEITLDNNDDADSVSAKVNEAYAALDPKPTDPTKESSDKYTYTFKEYDCTGSGVDYTCKATFDSTGRFFEVTVNLPSDARLICTGDPLPDGAANCNEDGSAIKHQYDVETTPLPAAEMTKDVEGEKVKDDSWTFKGWFDNENGIADGSMEGGAGKQIEAISAESFGDTAIYPYFTKTIEIVVPDVTPTQTISVVIDNNDDADSVSAKIDAAWALLEDPKPTPTKESSDKYDYTFKEFDCSVSGVEYTCEAVFNSTGRVFDVAVNLPEGASLVCTEGATGAENCTDDGKSIKYQYGEGASALPAADMEGWTFDRWVDGSGSTVSSIGNEEFGDKSFTPVFKKNIEVVIGDVTLEVEILYTDTDEQIQEKIAAAMAAHDPKIDTPTKEDSDTHTFTFDKFVVDEDGKYVPSFDSTGRVFDVVVNLPEGASLVCTEGATGAENCSTDGKSIKHQYDVETTPLPNADMEGWTFKGWFKDGADFTEPAVTSIDAKDYGDNIEIFPKFTKELVITLSEDPKVKVEITLDNNDDADSVSKKVNEAYAALDPKPTDPTKDSDEKYDYTFDKYECSEEAGVYTCEAVFNSTGRVFEVAVNLPEGASLVCTAGAPGAENCSTDGKSIKYQYGEGASALPAADMEGWTFDRWVDGSGSTVSSIGNEEFGDKSFTPVFKKNIEVVIGDVTLEVEILYTDTDEQIQEKIATAMAAHDPKIDTPTKEDSDTHTFTFDKFVVDEDGKYVPSFDSTGRVFDVVVNLPEGASLVCTGDPLPTGAANCNEDGSGIVHQYGKETTPLPDVVIVDGEGEVDETWKFHGWFDNPDGIDDGTNGKEVTSISKDEYGDNINIYPYFTKQIEITLSGDPEVKVEITIDNNDNADSVSQKVNEAYENITPAPADPTKAPNDSLEYTFKEYECKGTGIEYTCEAKFDSTGRVFEVVENLPEGATLVCTEGAKGAANCNEDGSGIVHQYGKETTPLPNAVIVDGEGKVDETWEFQGWFDNADGIDDGTNGKEVTSISKDEYGDNINIYPYFTKQIEITLSEDPEVKVTITLDNNDDADSVSQKVNDAYENITPAPADPTKDTSDKYIYTFKEYKCSGTGIDYTCEAKFDSTGRVFEVVENLPEGATLVCTDGAKGAANCNEDGSGIVHQYGKETTPLPDVVIVDGEGEVDETWKFHGWFDNPDGFSDGTNGNEVTSISKDEYGDNINIYPYFTKELEITLSRDPEVKVEITIDNNDNADSVSKKVNEAYENITPAPADPTKAPNDSLEYTFKEYECKGTGIEYTCEAKFDSTGRVFEVVENLPEGATLVCTEGAKGAANCNEDGTGIVHQYGKETTPLPNVVIVDGEGKVDETWEFQGWFDNADGIDDGTNGKEVTSISKDEYGDNINIYPYFTKQIEITLSEDPEVKVTITLDNNDNADSVSQKVNEAVAALDPKPSDPTRPMDDSLVYTFREYECTGTGVDYTCEAKFDSTGRVFEVVENLPEGATLVCTAGAKGAANCNEDGSGIVHQYGKETTPLPDAAMDGWTFEGWFGDSTVFAEPAVTSIPAAEYGDEINIFPKFTKQLEITLSEDPEVKVTITLDNNDNADSVSQKVNDAYENLTPAPEDPTRPMDDSLVYTFKEYECTGTGIDFTCEAKFDSTGRVFEVVENLPEGATLVCTDGAKGAANCNEDGTGIVHQYGKETTPLPNVVIVDGEGKVDETWEFQGWFDNADGIDDGTNGKEVSSISKDEYGDNINIYPYFTKQIEITLSEDPEVKVEITIDNNDNADSVSKKVNEAVAALEPKPDTPTKESSDKYDYVFEGYECTGSGVDFTCEAKFDSTGRVFEVVENLPEGATLVCTDGAKGAANCNEDGTGIVHQYGKETTPLPDVAMEGWTFEGWYGDGTIFAEPVVTSIPADEYGEEINIFPKFTKQIEITLSEDPEVKVTITLDNNDDADSVSKKVNEAYENITPAPADPTRPMDDSLVYTFREYECTGTGVDYTCEAKFDSTGRVFEVVENLSDNMKLVCEGEAAAACNEFETGIEHKYGVETNPLPEVVIVDSEGKVDEFWEFQGWFDNADGIDDGTNGNKVEKIDAEVFGDVVIYPYFTKVIEVVIGDQTIKIVIDDNDTQDSINAKVSEAAKNHDPVIEPDPKHIEKEPFIYDFAGYKCELLESNRYECVPDFDESGKKYEVAVNLPKDAKLLCEGEAAAACNEAGDAIVHQYGTETSPLPSAVIIGMDGSVDESWHFRGWFDNENGIADGSMEGGAGKKIFEIAAERYGDIDIYPYFTKTIQVKIGNEVVDVVIDNNDTQDSISVKATEAAANREPPIPTPTKDKDDKYEYEFAGYVCDQKFVCEPTFDAVPYDVEVVLAYGDDAEDTIMVKVLSTDDVPTIEKKVYVEFMSHDPMLPIPEKASDPMYTYEFNKFAVNLETGRYEPKFTSSPRIYKITFNMPEDAKLTKEISGNTYGEETILPQAVINGSDWQFKGWYTEKDGNGSRVKVIGAQDVGAREYFALFQKTVVYEVNGKQGNLEVAYSANASKAVDLALSGVIVKDFEENGKTYTFSKWELKKGVYVAKFTDITAIAQTNVPHFSVIAVDRTLEITGAKMGAKIAVFDLGGRLVTTGIVANGTQLVELANPGSYIVRVNNQVRRVNVR